MSTRALLVLGLLCGCGLVSPGDAGSPGGGSGGGGGTAGGDSGGGAAGGSAGGTAGGAAGGTAGGSAGGTAGGTAGGAAGGTAGGSAGGGPMFPYFDAGRFTGDGGNFTWLPLINAATTDLIAITGVAAFPDGELWFTASAPSPVENLIFYAALDGGVDSPTFAVGTQSFTDVDVTSSPQAVGAAYGNTFFSCTRSSNCQLPGSWSANVIGDGGYRALGLCSNGRTFYAVGDTPAFEGVVMEAVGSVLVPRAVFPTAFRFYDCRVLPDGTVVASGFGRVGYLYPDGGTDLVAVTPPGLANPGTVHWFGINSIGYRVFLAGDGKNIAHLMPDGGFELRFSSASSGNFKTLAGLFLEEQYAAGDDAPFTANAGYDGITWIPLGPFGGNRMEILKLFARDANHYYAAGREVTGTGSAVGAQLLIGRR